MFSRNVEEKGIVPAYITALRAVINVVITTGREILSDVSGHAGGILVELRNILQVGAGKTQDRTVERRNLSVVLTVETDGRVKLRLLDDNVGQTTFFGLSTDMYVQVIL